MKVIFDTSGGTSVAIDKRQVTGPKGYNFAEVERWAEKILDKRTCFSDVSLFKFLDILRATVGLFSRILYCTNLNVYTTVLYVFVQKGEIRGVFLASQARQTTLDAGSRGRPMGV